MSTKINAIRGPYVKKGIMDSVGVCDRTGFWFSTQDLEKQMEWRGNSLEWTGLMVGKPFLDEPNEQLRPPLVKADPAVVKDQRPPQLSPTAPSYEERLRALRSIIWGMQ